MREQKFFICRMCGNLIGMIEDKAVPVKCCDQKMAELKPNTAEAAVEKHLPVVKVNGTAVEVAVGSAPHPMTSEHSIDFIYVQTEQGGQRKNLDGRAAASASFALAEGDKPVAVFAYCNLHGLWKTAV